MIVYVPKHFKKEELAPKELCDKYTSVEIFAMFDPNILMFADRLRDDLGKAITVNNWNIGGKFSQRGIRTDNTVGATRSPHRIIPTLGQLLCCALDFDVEGMSAKEVRNYLKLNQKKYPEVRRCENSTNWVHVDTIPVIYFFNP